MKGEIEKKNQFKKNQKNKDKIWKNNISQIGMEQWNWKEIEILQKLQEKKLWIKRIRIKVEILINKRTTLEFWMVNANFKRIKEKR